MIIRITGFLAILTLLFTSCTNSDDPGLCGGVTGEKYDFKFNILNSDSNDVVFGSNSQYDVTRIKLYRKSSTGSIDLEPFTYVTWSAKDSSFRLDYKPSQLEPAYAAYYLKLNSSDTDTIEFFQSGEIMKEQCFNWYHIDVTYNGKKFVDHVNSLSKGRFYFVK